MFRRQWRGNVLPRFPSPRRRKRTQLQVAIYSPLVADACPQPVAGQLNTCGHVLYIVPSHPDANPLGARRQRDSRRFRRQRAPQRGQQRVQRGRLPLREIVAPPGRGRHRDRVNPHHHPALRSSVQETHRLADHRRHRVHAVDGQQPVHPLGFRPSQEPGAAQDHVAPDPVARLIGLAAGQRGLERPGEYPQRRRQRHHHRQRCVGQRVPGHPPQRQRHPRRRRALPGPRGGLHHPGQRAQHQERQRQQRRRRRHQQRRVQRRPAPGQRSFHEPAPLPDLPDQHPQRHHRQHVDVIPLQPRSRRRPRPGAQEVQDSQPGQVPSRHREHGQAQQAPQRAHGVHLPGQADVQRRVAHAGPVGRVNRTHQEQAADSPRQQRPDGRRGHHDQTLANRQHPADLPHARAPAPHHRGLGGPRPRQQADRQRQEIQDHHHYQRYEQEQRRARQGQLSLVGGQQAGAPAVFQAGQDV